MGEYISKKAAMAVLENILRHEKAALNMRFAEAVNLCTQAIAALPAAPVKVNTGNENDLIPRGDALECFMGLDRIGDIKDAIAALPAAPVGVNGMGKLTERIWAWWDDEYDVGVINTHGDKRYTPSNAQEYVAALPAAHMGVKPLEWTSAALAWAANTSIGGYKLYDGGGNWADDRFTLHFAGLHLKSYPRLEAAKAAAQADYESRILAALTPQPAPALRGEQSARISELEKALRFGCGAAINGLNDESGALPEWSEGSGIAVMLNALGCHERRLNERVRFALADPKGGAE